MFPDQPIDPPSFELHSAAHFEPVAPVWHTLVLIAGIILMSFAGAHQLSGANAQVNRLPTYAFTAGTELCMIAWIWFGLRLRKIPFRSLFGSVSGNFLSIAVDAGLAIGWSPHGAQVRRGERQSNEDRSPHGTGLGFAADKLDRRRGIA